MSKLQRAWNLLIGLVMILSGVVLLVDPKDGLTFVAYILGLALVVYGVRMLWYYVTMARHMVGGLSLLFIAVITIDIGVFALALVEDPKLSIVLFLVGYNAYTGILSIARGVESKMFESRWVLSVLHGLVNLALAAGCIVFIGSDQIVIAIFCLGLFYSAVVRLASVFKKTEIIYIQ